MAGAADDSRIYLVDSDEGRIRSGGAVVVGPDGVREDVAPGVFAAVQQVVAAMRAGRGVTVVPLRTELPVDEAADAIGMGRDDFRAYVADGAVSFRSSEYVDWVRLADVVEWDNQRRRERSAALQELLDDEPWDSDGAGLQDS
jgi:hypothetical protein